MKKSVVTKLTREVDSLCQTVNPRAMLPRGFQFWSEKMQVMWLRANQRKEVTGERKRKDHRQG